MRRTVLPLVLALLAAPLALAATTTPVSAQEEVKAKVNDSMSDALPRRVDGWKRGEVRPATGALPMYSAATAEAVYKKGEVEVTVGTARSPTLFKAIMGSVKVPSTLPPNGKIENVAGRKAIVIRYPEAKVPLYQIQIPVGTDGIVMLTTRTGTVEHLVELAKEVDFDPFPLR